MIRKHPRNDVVNPPGQIVNKVPGVASPIQQSKTLEKEISEYQRGWNDGYKACENEPFFPDLGSEAAR